MSSLFAVARRLGILPEGGPGDPRGPQTVQ